jgi:hypothetical protein
MLKEKVAGKTERRKHYCSGFASLAGTQAIMPKFTTQAFFTRSRNGPKNAMAMTKCAKANQSVP